MGKSPEYIEPAKGMPKLITNPQMTYCQLAGFIVQFLANRRHDAILTQQEMQDYRDSIKNDPLLEELLNQYLPYSKKWQPIVWRSTQAYPEPIARVRPKDVHDIAFTGPRAVCRKWLAKTYPHKAESRFEKKQAISEFFKILVGQVEDGLHDTSLLLQEKQRYEELAAETVENLGFPGLKMPLDDVSKLRADLKEYILFLDASMHLQTASVNELLSLWEWVKQPVNEGGLNLQQRFAIIVEVLDEGRTAYYAGGSYMGKKYTCPIGLEERLLDRAIFIMNTHSKDKLLTPEELLVSRLVGRFVQRDHVTESFVPTNAFYKSYLKAAGWITIRESCNTWSLSANPGDKSYEEALHCYILYKKNKIEQDFASYQSEKAYRQQQRLQGKRLTPTELTRFSYSRLLIAAYLDETAAVEGLIPNSLLDKLLQEEFEVKIQRCLSWDSYLESLGQEQNIFTKILYSQSEIRQRLVLTENAHDWPMHQIIKTMGRDIGFDREHIELLLAIISKLELGATPEESGLNILKSYAQNNILSIEGPEIELDHAEWYRQTYDLYMEYLSIGDDYDDDFLQPFISILPVNFNNFSVLAALNSQLNERSFGQGIKCSAAIFRRLWNERKIQLYNPQATKTAVVKGTQANSLSIVRTIVSQSQWIEGLNAYILLSAAEYGYVDILKEALQYALTYELAFQDMKRRSIWDLAALRGQLEIFLFLGREYPAMTENAIATGTPLMLAIKNNQEHIVEFLLENYPCLKKASSWARGYSFLMAAAETGAVNIAFKLINHGMDLSLCDKNGQNCLFYAVSSNRLPVVSLLLNYVKKFDINTVSGHYETVLSIAIKKGYAEIAKRLLGSGAMLYAMAQDHANLLCNTAITSGNIDVVAALLSDGYLDLSHQDSHGNSPLHLAAKLSIPGMIDFLINSGADLSILNNEGRNFLMVALWKRAPEHILRTFLQRPEITVTYLNHRDYYGNTVLNYAILADYAEMVADLVRKGVETLQFSYYKKTALILAAERGHMEIIEILLSHTNSSQKMLNFKDFRNETALQKALNRQNYQVVELLFSFGAQYYQNRGISFFYKTYPSDYITRAIEQGQFINLFIALSNGTRAKPQDFILAVERQRSGIIGLLLATGNKLPKAIDNHNNLLMRAAELGDIKTVNLLLPQMIYTLEFKNEDGLGAEQLALRAGHNEIAILLHSAAPLKLRPQPAPKLFSNILKPGWAGVCKKTKVAPSI